MALTVDPERSPRLVWVDAATDDITVQTVVDELRDWEDSPDGMSYPFLISAAGKEQLGGGVTVGITATLQDAQIAFTPDSDSTEEGTITTGSSGRVVTDTAALFQTAGVTEGAVVINKATGAFGTVLSIDSETQLTITALVGGSRQDFQAADDYAVHNVVQKNISGGNLVAVDSVGGELDPVFPTAFTQVVRTSSSSATLQELADIQFASFQGGVWYDSLSGFSGVEYPTGTERQPVDNFNDGLSIADERGFNTFYIRGNATIDSGLDYTDYVFIGQGQNLSAFTITAAADVTNGTFREAEIAGTLDGDSHLEDCIIGAVTFISGVIENCILNPSTITLGGNATAHFIDCESGVPGTGTPTIDCGGSGQALALRGYNGGIKLINKTGPEAVSIDLVSGQVVIDTTTVTNGDIVVRGTGKVVDQNGDPLVSGAYGSMTLYNETVSGIMIQEMHRILGLDSESPMTVTPTQRTAGNVVQLITGDGETTTTVTRQ